MLPEKSHMKAKLAPNISTVTSFLLFVWTVAIPASADIITVTNTNDNGPGSLRQALADANDGDTIEFAVTGTIGLTSGELVVDKSLTISGPGADSLAVNGSAKSRVFYVGPDAVLTISQLSITNGNATTDFGGGIYNDQSTLTLNNCELTGNDCCLHGSGNTGCEQPSNGGDRFIISIAPNHVIVVILRSVKTYLYLCFG